MFRRFVAIAAAAVMSATTSIALAQCNCGGPVTSYVPDVPSCTTHCAPAVVHYASAPRTTYLAPAAPHVTYYVPVAQPYTVSFAPAAQPRVAYYGVAGWSLYGTPKVYVPGEPVRNVWRAITP